MKLIKTTAIALMAFAGLASCSKDDNGNGPGAEGNPTYMTLSFVTPQNTGTRANGDTNATEEESQLKTVDVFIFETASGIQSKNQRINVDPSTFDQADNIYTGRTKIETTTGDKTVLIGINLTAALRSALQGETLAQAKSTVRDVTVSSLTNTTDGFVMFSDAPVQKTLVESEDGTLNQINVTVKRLVSKLTVEASGTMQVHGGFIVASTLAYNVRNLNSKAFIVPKSTTTYEDPNYTFANGAAAAAAASTDFTDEADYVAFDNGSTPNVKYLTENTTSTHYQAETSYASIKVKFIPATVLTDNGDGTFTEETNTVATPAADFWRVTHNGASYYFFDETAADAYMTEYAGDNPVKSDTYDQGYCYFNMFLYPSANYSIPRNKFLKATITTIYGPGNPGAFEEDPTSPVNTGTNVLCNITVANWDVIPENYDLRP